MRQNKAIWGIILLMVMVLLPYANAALTDNLVSYYKLDESSGTVIDSTGNASGTNNGATTGVTGKINTAYSFVTNDYINTTSKPNGANFSYQAWINRGTYAAGSYGAVITSNNLESWLGVKSDGLVRFHIKSDGTAYYDTATGVINAGQWYHIVATWDGTFKLYVNGVLTSTSLTGTPANPSAANIYIGSRVSGENPWNGTIDEVAIFNKSLNQTEVTALYNSGNGLAYPFVNLPFLSLVSPTNQTTISDIGTNFTVEGSNLSSVAGTWKNVTYYVWDNSSAIHNQTTVSLNNETFNQTLFIDEFTLGNYSWNARAGYTNATGLYYVWATNNYTFSVIPFSTLETDYHPYAIEGSNEPFTMNISIISFERMSTVNFIYNGTAYPITPVKYDTNKWYMPVNLTVPQVTANTNLSFYWSVRLESGLIYNTTAINQTVYNIGLDNCGTNTNQLFNLTIKDETSQATLVGATDNTSIKTTVTLLTYEGVQIANYTAFFNKVNPSRVCLSYPMNNSTFKMDAIIEFSSSGRFTEFYNIQDYILNSTTQSQNITLYNLNSSIGQEYKITYKGLDFTPVSDLLIQIQRKYIDEGVFKTIEIPMSGTNGYTIAHLVTNDVIYNLIFIKDGVVLDTFTDVIATCQNPSFTECEINLNALVGGTDLIGLVQENDFFSSLSYNTATRTITSTYGITSGVSGTTQLQVYLLDNFGTTNVCNDSLIAAGGTLSCVIPESFGNSSVQARILLNGDIRREGYISLASSPKEKYSGILVFMSIIMLMFLIGIGIQDNPTIMGVFLILGLFILIALNMVYTQSWIGVGATALWFVIAVVLILIKGGNKR